MNISDKIIIHKIYSHYFKYGITPTRKNLMESNEHKVEFISLAMWCIRKKIDLDKFIEMLDGYG